jgi:thiol-disulfide isomerase/thioredoxin
MSSRNSGNNPRSGSGGQRAPGKKPSKAQMQKKQAAQRAMAAASGKRSARHKQLIQVLVPVVVVLVVVGILVGVHAANSNNSGKHHGTKSADAAVVTAVTSVPVSVTNKAGAGDALGPTKRLHGPRLSSNGKPRVLYVGADWCPYCAAERWALAQALSRFGTLTGLGETRSSPDDADPNTATVSFHGSKYSSKYIALTAKEIENGEHKPLDKLSKADNKLFLKLTGQKGSFPFLDIGGKYQFGVQYDPAVLKGKTQAEIADAMSDPSSKIGKSINSSANVLTAATCELTKGQPSKVCTASGVQAAKKKLTSAQK